MLLVVLAIALTGCAPATLTLWTDTPEFITAIERFNAEQSDSIVEVVYVEDPGSRLRTDPTPPDVIVARYIENEVTAAELAPLDRVVRGAEDRFYPDLLESGRVNGRLTLLPVAFSLPLVYYVEPSDQFEERLIIDVDEIRGSAADFDVASDIGYTQLAYSPVWEPEFLYQFTRLTGLLVTESGSGEPTWDFERLLEAVADARAWISEHGGPEQTRRFSEQYLYDPHIQLVRRGRVRYGYDETSTFLARSDASRSDLAFRWLGESGSILVLEDVVYAGIPTASRQRRDAEDLLARLFTLEFQRDVLESAATKRGRGFGLAGGFSSLWEVNERILPGIVPEIAGLVPDGGSLVFPPASPRYWGEIVDDVVTPWLVRETLAQPQSRDLEQSVRAWLLQQEN